MPVYYKQLSSAPKLRRFTTHELHSLLGSRSLKRWEDIAEISKDTVRILDGGERPLELGDVANLKSARRNLTPVPKPEQFLDVVHCDLGYSDCASVGGIHYVLMAVDRATRYTWAFGLKSLVQEEIITGFTKFRLLFGNLPRRIYTDFDHHLLSGQTEQFLNKHGCETLGAPASRQHQNGLVQRQWQTLMSMARSFLSNKKMPRIYWWWAICHSSQILNYFLCTVNGYNTSPLELVFGVKPDYGTLFPLFALTYFKHMRYGQRARDGVEAKVLQSILLSRAENSDLYLLFSPFTQEFYVSGDCKIDSGNCTASAFNLKDDGGIFIGLYDSSHVSNETEPYPPGTNIIYSQDDGSQIHGTVTSAPLPDTGKAFPTSSSSTVKYSVKLRNGDTVLLTAESIDILMQARYDKSQSSLPKWLHNDAKIMLFHKHSYLKGWLSYNKSNDDPGWEFQIRKRNGDI